MKTQLVKKPVLPEDVGTYMYQPIFKSDVDFISKFADGDVVKADIRRDRLYKLTKKYWALCNLVAENHKAIPEYEFLDHKNKVDEHIKLSLGIIKSHMVYPDGRVHVVTGSISHTAKDQDAFQEIFDKAIEIMSRISGISTADLDENWMNYECLEGDE